MIVSALLSLSVNARTVKRVPRELEIASFPLSSPNQIKACPLGYVSGVCIVVVAANLLGTV